jgi:hypothetical protein
VSHFIDTLARRFAGASSRREALQQLGAGIGGLFFSSLGLNSAAAVTLCGTCQACDLDGGTCTTTCPDGTAKSLCDQNRQDGSYIRLSNFLESQGYTRHGKWDSVLFYEGGALNMSTLSANFVAASKQTAQIVRSVSPEGDVTTYGMMFDDGVVTFALSVDPDGRIVQTVSNYGNGLGSGGAPGHSPDQSTCRAAWKEACQFVEGNEKLDCRLLAAKVCIRLKSRNGYVLAGCFLAIDLGCYELKKYGCKYIEDHLCPCDFNIPSCNGTCCGPCEICQGGTCVANTNCPNGGQCCNNQCCAPGYTCKDGVCTSPSTQCNGATCDTFVPCSAENSDCVCVTVSDGGGFCVPGSTACDGLDLCPDGLCPPGSLCAIGTCCGDPVCIPESLQCPTDPLYAHVARAAARGPTIAHR